jgi:hypothetical protein
MEINVTLPILVCILNPRNATDNIGTKAHGLPHVFLSACFAPYSILWKRNHLDIHQPLELFTNFQVLEDR